jgi:hypothetical protein
VDAKGVIARLGVAKQIGIKHGGARSRTAISIATRPHPSASIAVTEPVNVMDKNPTATPHAARGRCNGTMIAMTTSTLAPAAITVRTAPDLLPERVAASRTSTAI